MSFFPENFPLHAPLALFNSLLPGTRHSPASSLAMIFESELHRHHMHLPWRVAQNLRAFVMAFIFSMHMSDAYREELKICQSYFFDDKDQVTLITIKQNPNLPDGEYEIRPFIIQTNPNIILRNKISSRTLRKVRKQLELDGMGNLYHELTNSPIGVIEIVRPIEKRFRFWNAFGQEVVCEDSAKPPFKVYAYLTEFKTTKKVFSTNIITTLKLAEIPVVLRVDFIPSVETNQIRFAAIMYEFLRQFHQMFNLVPGKDNFVRFSAGFTMGVKHKYGLAVNSRVSIKRPDIAQDITFLLDNRPSSLEISVTSPPVVVSVRKDLKDVGTTRILVPEEIQMLTSCDHMFWQRLIYPNEHEFSGDSIRYPARPLRFDIAEMLANAGDSAHIKVELLVFEAIKRALRYYGPNTVKQVLLGMSIGESHVGNPVLDMRYAVYTKKEYAGEIMTIVYKTGSFGYVVNVLDSDMPILFKRGEDVKLDHDEMVNLDITRYSVLNVEMRQSLARNRDEVLDRRYWHRIPYDFLHSLAPDGVFPGLVYLSVREERVGYLRSNPEMKLKRFPRFIESPSTVSDGFMIKTYLEKSIYKLLSGPSIHLCPVHTVDQALALSQTTLSKYTNLVTVAFDKTVSVIFKFVEETQENGEIRTRPMLIFHKFEFSTDRPSVAMVPFRQAVELAYPQIGHLTTAVTVVNVDVSEDQTEVNIFFCQSI